MHAARAALIIGMRPKRIKAGSARDRSVLHITLLLTSTADWKYSYCRSVVERSCPQVKIAMSVSLIAK